MGSKKRRRREERATIHPKNKYSDNPPDFALLASLYPSFNPFVFYSGDGRPRIDWTDFNATRELTRVLLCHDHGLDWWIPDGQLCPTVPNRSNYIHWIEDLLSSNIIPRTSSDDSNIKGFDIGTGANCIYPLLGASLLGWSFVASDVTDVAVEWAERNVRSNPHISELIEIRKVKSFEEAVRIVELSDSKSVSDDSRIDVQERGELKVRENSGEAEATPSCSFHMPAAANGSYHGPPILLDVVKDGEKFDFCMCNPPFFESIEQAGLNPKTSCGGTPKEMVCPGGEKAFISRMIEDSTVLKQTFRWYTSMVGRKVNLKFLISKLREAGVTIVKTTEFVQGQTSRWGLAWSFVSPVKKIILPHAVQANNLSFMLEGLERKCGAINVLQAIETFLCTSGATCKMNASSFTVDITASADHCGAILKYEMQHPGEVAGFSLGLEATLNLCFRISVFQQTPGTLLVKGSLQTRDSPLSGLFSLIFQRLGEVLRDQFCGGKAGINIP